MKSAVRGIALGLAAFVVIGAAAIAWVKLAPRPTPVGQPALASLTEKSFTELKDAFNASAGRTRVVALLSPT